MEEMLNYDFDFEVNGAMVRNYCTSCSDKNPIHFSPHNVVPGGLITGLLLSNPVDNYYIRKLETKFLNVTYYPATIKVKRKVTSYKIGRSGIRANMEMVAIVNNEIVCSAVGEVFKPNEEFYGRIKGN